MAGTADAGSAPFRSALSFMTMPRVVQKSGDFSQQTGASSPNTVRRSDCFCTHDARFGVAAVVWNASRILTTR